MTKRLAFVGSIVTRTRPAGLRSGASKRPSPSAQAQCKFSDGKTVKSGLFQSARERPKDIWWPGTLRRSLACRSQRSHDAGHRHEVRVGDKDVPPGSYTLFTIPNADKWTLIISKKTGEWGIPYPGRGEDFVRVDMKVSPLPSPVENFTIGFDQTGSTCAMHLDWETTRASVDIAEKK